MSSDWDFEFAVIDKHQLLRLVPYSLSQITRLEEQNLFPRRLKLGPSRVGWKLIEIYEFIEKKSLERDEKP